MRNTRWSRWFLVSIVTRCYPTTFPVIFFTRRSFWSGCMELNNATFFFWVYICEEVRGKGELMMPFLMKFFTHYKFSPTGELINNLNSNNASYWYRKLMKTPIFAALDFISNNAQAIFHQRIHFFRLTNNHFIHKQALSLPTELIVASTFSAWLKRHAEKLFFVRLSLGDWIYS